MDQKISKILLHFRLFKSFNARLGNIQILFRFDFQVHLIYKDIDKSKTFQVLDKIKETLNSAIELDLLTICYAY